MRHSRQHSVSCRQGFSIMELLVVTAVVSTLLALLLPAVQQSREAARLTQCRNNLKQIVTAVHAFESTHREFPANGWGFAWIGDPTRGVGEKQPGGWIFQLAPHLEGSALTDPNLPPSVLAETPLPTFKCPTRPSFALSEGSDLVEFHNVTPPALVAKTDYAVNEGDFITNTPGGPSSLAEGDDPAFPWTDVSDATGVSFLRTGVRTAQITDGLSNTYFAGEKYVDTTSYLSGSDLGHDQTMYSGVDLDTTRWTIDPPLRDRGGPIVRRFGSAHQDGCHMAFCDGSVKFVSYRIDARVHRQAGNRHDGRP